MSLENLQEEIDPKRTRELAEAGEIELIDVREPHEREAGHIDGSEHIQMPDLTAYAETLDKDRPVVFYCRVGSRSAMATQAFRASGYDAHNMSGGIVAWVEAGLPLVPEGGTVANH